MGYKGRPGEKGEVKDAGSRDLCSTSMALWRQLADGAGWGGGGGGGESLYPSVFIQTFLKSQTQQKVSLRVSLTHTH